MKFVVYAIAILCSAAGFSQHAGGAYLTKGNTCLVYNHAKDTIQLSNPDFRGLGSWKEGKIFAEVQIDGKGAKEVVVYRSFEGAYQSVGNMYVDNEDMQCTLYEIWNIDKKELLFSAKCANRFSFDYTHYATSLGDSHCLAYYNYDFLINDAGTITISNVQVSDCFSAEDNTLSECQKAAVPDHQEGIYTFKNGKYSKQ